MAAAFGDRRHDTGAARRLGFSIVCKHIFGHCLYALRV
jgi:hypothetical protein